MAEPSVFNEIKPLVAAGFAIHWLHPRQKRPYGYDWASRPVATLQALRASYRQDNNVGVRLGRYSQVGDLFLHVLDIDIWSDDDAETAWGALADLFPDVSFDDFPTVQSGSGGPSRHIYFLTDHPFSSKKLAHSGRKFSDAAGKKHWTWEIELFGTGKQVAMPPSIHPDTGQPYRWLRPFDFDLLDLGVVPYIPAEAFPGRLEAELAVEAASADDDVSSLLALARRSTPLGLTDDQAWDILRALDLDDWCEDRDGWLQVGMALHHEFEGEDAGYELWCRFSQQSDRFDEDDQRRVWKSFRLDRGETITMGFFRKLVREDGLEFTLCQRVVESTEKYRNALTEAAKFELLSSEQDVILNLLAKKAEQEGMVTTKAALRRDLTAARREYEKAQRSGAQSRISIETWLAQEVLRVFFGRGDHLIFVAGNPWLYRKGLWSMTDKEFINNRVWLVVEKLMAGAKGAPEGLLSAIRESDRTDYMNALISAVSGMIAKMQAHDSGIDPLRLKARVNESVMNCATEELWFEDGEFEVRDHDPSNRFTNQINAVYDPDAESPLWDAALKRIFRDCRDPEGMIRHLHEVMGYLVQSSRDMALWVMFHGAGANGKSFVAGVLQHIMGHRSAVSQEMRKLNRDNHATAGLVGKLLLLDDDFPKRAQLPDGWIKKLSESKALTANPKFGASFDFVSRATPMLLTNHWPQTSDLSHGMVRRAMIFNFNTTIGDDEADLTLFSRVADQESSGVLNHLIEGWCRVQRRGGFIEPIDCTLAKQLWLGRRNALASFVSEEVTVTGNSEDRVEAAVLWDAFRYWCIENNTDNKWGRNRFYDELQQATGVDMIHPRNVKTFTGVRLDQPPREFGDDDILDLI